MSVETVLRTVSGFARPSAKPKPWMDARFHPIKAVSNNPAGDPAKSIRH
jgi:hypothetical protein